MELDGSYADRIATRRWNDLGLLVSRVGIGATLLVRHGYPKVPALLSHPDQFFDPLGLGPTVSLVLATFAELVCALLVILGLLGRLPYLPLITNFAVIVVALHRLQVPGDRGELALLYLVAFSALALAGPGRYSLGTWLSRRRESAVNPAQAV